MNAQLVEDLRAARALVERGWCQAASARTRSGDETFITWDDARSWCAGGAIAEVLWEEGENDPRLKAARKALRLAAAWPLGIERWNDAPGRTQSEVLAAFDRAIAAAEAA